MSVQLADFDQGRDGDPMLGASVGTLRTTRLPAKRNRADGVLDGVVIELDAAVIDESRQASYCRIAFNRSVAA